MAVEKIRLHRFMVEEEWSGLETISNILAVTIMITLSSETSIHIQCILYIEILF